MKIMRSFSEGVIFRERERDKNSGDLPNLFSVTDCFLYRFTVVK